MWVSWAPDVRYMSPASISVALGGSKRAEVMKKQTDKDDL